MISLFSASRQSSDARRVFVTLSLSSPPAYRRGVQLLSVLHCAHGKLSKTNLNGPDTEQTSIDGNRARHGLTSWLIALLPGVWRACCDLHLAPQCRYQTQIA